MEASQRPNLKYLSVSCPFLKKEVWAILTQEAAVGWRIVNCLDKDRPCFGQDCAFTKDNGQWPFEFLTVPSDYEQGNGQPH